MAEEVLRLDQDRRGALERVARRRHVSVRDVLLEAVDEYLERLEDEALLERSAQDARRTGWREEDAVDVVRQFRQSRATPGNRRS